MSTSEGSARSSTRPLVRAAQVIIVSSVMFTFIGYWRTAAVVLCDLASTAYYIGAIVEQSIGKAAPWFILAVMIFSYAVRSVYIESCSLFVRGGVYRVVKEAMGGFLAKLSVSALMFDYVLTGPISAVTAGQYIVGLVLDFIAHYGGVDIDAGTRDQWKAWGSILIASAITLYFFRQNLLGIHESSDKAVKIMIVTTIMAVIMMGWCGFTLLTEGARNPVPPVTPNFNLHQNPNTKEMENPLGFIGETGAAQKLRDLSGNPEKGIPPAPPADWFSLIGLIGLAIAFGHSILAMSGEERLAQVYREVESPKLPNFKKAAFIVFVYSLILTAGISFLAVLLIPDNERMVKYGDNLIGGLAMSVAGPISARFLLNAFVVVVGFLILAGAVNTAIIGSNGVLNRVSEDGVMPDWFRKPHPRYGTTYRLLFLILFLQLFTIIASRGDVILLGEAYAFGVVWSFVFKALAMVVLRFKDPSPREFMVPGNVHIGRYQIPVGLGLIFIILLIAALMNLLTKETATIWGLAFTVCFLTIFMVSEYVHEKRRHGRGLTHEHLEQFNQQVTGAISPVTLHLTKPYRKLVAIRSPQNLFMLEKSLAETDPECTDVVVMTAKFTPPGESGGGNNTDLDRYDQQLMTAVVERGEKAGKPIKPLIVPTNNPVHAILKTAKALQAQEVIVGASNKFTAEEQLDQIAFYWISLHEGTPPPLTVRVLSRSRDVYLDLEGGSRIPKISEIQARTVAELRAAGVGVERVLLVHDGTPASSDIFRAVMTMLDPQVTLDLAAPAVHKKAAEASAAANLADSLHLTPLAHDQERARKLGREIDVHALTADWGPQIVRLAQEGRYGILFLPRPEQLPAPEKGTGVNWIEYVRQHAPCLVARVSLPLIPQQVDE